LDGASQALLQDLGLQFDVTSGGFFGTPLLYLPPPVVLRVSGVNRHGRGVAGELRLELTSDIGLALRQAGLGQYERRVLAVFNKALARHQVRKWKVMRGRAERFACCHYL
jgi:hypothetical protein